MRPVFFILIFLFSIVPVHAALESIKSTTTIEGTTAYIDYFITVSYPQDPLRIPAAIDAQVMYAKDTYGDIEATLDGDSLIITLQKTLEPGESRSIIMKVKSQSLVANKGVFDEYVWSVDLPFAISVENVVLLPEEETGFMSATPDAIIEIINDRHAIIWRYDSFSEGTLLARYKMPRKDSSMLMFAGIAIIFGALAVVMWAAKRKSAVPPIERNSSPVANKQLLGKIDLMNVKEKQVLSLLLEKGEINQYEIRAKTQLTKSNLSKIIKNLEMKGIIKREKIGKINRIVPGERLK